MKLNILIIFFMLRAKVTRTCRNTINNNCNNIIFLSSLLLTTRLNTLHTCASELNDKYCVKCTETFSRGQS